MSTKTLAAACLIVAGCWLPALAQDAVTSHYRPLQRTMKYVEDKDAFIRYRSAVAFPVKEKPGGLDSYYGTRLDQYRYVGKPGEGGYYDAWTEYVARRRLDPADYRYRLGIRQGPPR